MIGRLFLTIIIMVKIVMQIVGHSYMLTSFPVMLLICHITIDKVEISAPLLLPITLLLSIIIAYGVESIKDYLLERVTNDKV